jgi:hypothetical protein
MPFTAIAPEIRFFERVQPAEGLECWLWTGATDKDGYGRFAIGKREHRAHRWCFEHLRAPIPAGLTIDHLCRNTSCVNPWHLEPVPAEVNIKRRAGTDGGRDHCRNGHPYTESSVYELRGVRYCRPCAVIHSRNYRNRKAVSS